MARLDVHPMPGKGREGYVVDVQADLLSHLATRTVVSLLAEVAAPRPISEINPVFGIGGKRHVLVTQAIASIPGRELKRVPSRPSPSSTTASRAHSTSCWSVSDRGKMPEPCRPCSRYPNDFSPRIERAGTRP